MCTTYTTKNRAVLFNHYSVQTLLVDHGAYCPCGPNKPDYSVRSRLYNPDPKYQCHEDLTCHTYDSIPKGMSCSGYGGPSPPYPVNPNNIPCFANGPCYLPNDNCDGGCDEDPCKPIRCRRRKRKPPCCCSEPTTYKDLICSFQCREPCPEPCEEEKNESQGNCNSGGTEGGYSVQLPKDAYGAKVTYNCDPCGNVCRQVESCGNEVQTECTNGVLLETGRDCGPCGTGGVTVKSICCAPEPPCCPLSCPPPEWPGPCKPWCDPCCPPPCGEPCEVCPRPCKKPLLRCPLRTHNYCRCMSCSPRFWICSKPCRC